MPVLVVQDTRISGKRKTGSRHDVFLVLVSSLAAALELTAVTPRLLPQSSALIIGVVVLRSVAELWMEFSRIRRRPNPRPCLVPKYFTKYE